MAAASPLSSYSLENLLSGHSYRIRETQERDFWNIYFSKTKGDTSKGTPASPTLPDLVHVAFHDRDLEIGESRLNSTQTSCLQVK